MIKRFLALSAAAAIVGVAGVFAIGWALAAPVQTDVGNPPQDLGARPVESKAIQAQRFTAGGARLHPAAARFCFCQASALIG